MSAEKDPTAVISWEPPTARVDGTALDPATEIAKYILTCGTVKTDIPPTADAGGVTMEKATILPGYGETECYMQTVDTEGQASEPSNSDTVSWMPAAPAAPTQFIYLTDGEAPAE